MQSSRPSVESHHAEWLPFSRIRSTFVVTVALGFALAIPALCPAASYTVTDLGSLGGLSGGVASQAYAVNNHGQVTGFAYLGTEQHVFLYDGTMHDLGPGIGRGINDAGQVTGSSDTADGTQHAFLYDGMMHDLGPGYGAGINNRGEVTGTSNGRAFLYDGTMHLLPLFPGGGGNFGIAINDNGEVAGQATLPDIFHPGNVQHAFLYDGTMHDIGTPGGTLDIETGFYTPFESIAWAINGHGDVVGQDTGAPGAGAFLYSGGVQHGIGGIFPQGINNNGEVVGWAGAGAVIYTSGSGIVSLNSLIEPQSGWFLETANAINNAGQIVGAGRMNGVVHAYLLTPIPEPSSRILAALAGLALLAYRRRR